MPRSAWTAVSSSRTCSTTADDWNGCAACSTTAGRGRCSAPVIWSREMKPCCGHQRQDLVSAAQDGSGVVRGGRVVAGRLRNARQQRRLVGIIGSERGERPAEIVFRRPRKSVLPVAHVHEAGIAGENLFLRTTLRSEPLAHLFFDPQRQPDLFALPEHHVRVPRANHRRQGARQDARAPELVAVFLGRLVLEKHTAHELLRDRRAALREDRPAAHVVPPSSRRQSHPPGAQLSPCRARAEC